MSAFINSLLIEPVVRQARRFSWPPPDGEAAATLSHASGDNAAIDSVRSPHDRMEENPALIDDNERLVFLGNSMAPAAAPLVTGEAQWPSLHNVLDDHTVDRQQVSSPESVRDISQGDSTAGPSRQGSPPEMRTIDSFGSMSLDDSVMTQNPSFGVPRAMQDSSRRYSSPFTRIGASADASINRTPVERSPPVSREGSATNLSMPTVLPDDDGMKPLREKIHLIREMALSSEEKAKRMHALMVADYEAYRAMAEREGGSSKDIDSRLSVGSKHSLMTSLDGISIRSRTPGSTNSVGDTDDAFVISTDDLKPTYQPRSLNGGVQSPSDPETGVEEDEELSLGCQHYQRNVKIQCGDCKRWYTCRHCHDNNESHLLDRKSIKNMLCMLCGYPQKAGGYCSKCGEATAAYYCDICKLWENDPDKKIYHCADCGICRRGAGLGKDFFHCKRCNVCIAIAWESGHRCVERATECDCPICNDWMFTSSAAVVAMQCGHYIHRKCYDDYMHTSYKCPICNRSAVNMELQWRKLDQAIEAQPMPPQFSETKAWINCNDCGARSCTSYHWLGNKCTVCDSYNTNYTKLVNNPSDHEVTDISRSSEAPTLHGTQQAVSNHVDRLQVLDSPPNTNTAPQTTRTAHSGVVARSADSPAPSHESLFPSPELSAPRQAVQQSPTSTSTTLVDSHSYASSQPQSSGVAQRGDRLGMASLQTSDLDEQEDEDDDGDEDEDDVGFWGEGISPSSWSMPMGISPMSGWASPSFFASRMEARKAEHSGDDGEGDDAEEDEEFSTDDSDIEEAIEVEEDGDVEEIELFGHR